MWHQHLLSYVRITIVYDKSYSVDRPLHAFFSLYCNKSGDEHACICMWYILYVFHIFVVWCPKIITTKINKYLKKHIPSVPVEIWVRLKIIRIEFKHQINLQGVGLNIGL